MAPPVSGYSLWFDASNITSPPADGATLTSWNDLSGNAWNLTTGPGGTYYSSTSAKLINGLPTVWFTGSQYLGCSTSRQIQNATDGTWTIFVVGYSTTPTTNAMAFNADYAISLTNRLAQFLNFNANQIRAIGFDGSSNAYVAAGGTPVASPSLYCGGTTTARSVFVRANGTQVASATGPATSWQTGPAPFELGQRDASGSSSEWAGPIGEVLAYPTALTTAQIQSVEAYLQAKWATPAPPYSGAPRLVRPPSFVPMARASSW